MLRCTLALLLLAALLVPVLSSQQNASAASDGGLGAAANNSSEASPFQPAAPQPAANGSSSFGLATGIGAPGGEPRLQYQGVATVAYAQQPLGPYDAINLGCSLGFLSPLFQSNYIAVSSDYFQDAMACGRCIMVQCDDQSCTQPGNALPAIVADVCGSCTGSDLAISTPLFQNLTGRAPGAIPSIVVSWNLISCAPYTNGTIKMKLKDGGSAFYQAFAFSNYIIPIVDVQINGQRLKHGSDNYWAWNPGQPINPTQPLSVALLGSNRQILRAKVPSLRSADLGVQFNPS